MTNTIDLMWKETQHVGTVSEAEYYLNSGFIAEKDHYSIVENGDLCDFYVYGPLYVVNVDYSDDCFWVTDCEEDRNNPDCAGWAITKSFFNWVIEKAHFDPSYIW